MYINYISIKEPPYLQTCFHAPTTVQWSVYHTFLDKEKALQWSVYPTFLDKEWAQINLTGQMLCPHLYYDYLLMLFLCGLLSKTQWLHFCLINVIKFTRCIVCIHTMSHHYCPISTVLSYRHCVTHHCPTHPSRTLLRSFYINMCSIWERERETDYNLNQIYSTSIVKIENW